MRRTFTILFFILGFCLVTFAQNGNFELQLVNKAKIMFVPGATTNLVVRMENNTQEDAQVSLKINLPKGWKCFSELKDLQAPKLRSIIKILSLNIPSNTRADDYSISIEALNNKGEKIGKLKLPVTVVPKYSLKI